MNVLVIHNYDRQPGGEDEVVAAEVALLRAHGHEVELIAQDNKDLPEEVPFTVEFQ